MVPQFKCAPNNNIDPGGPGPLNSMFANQFKWAPYNNIYWAPDSNIDPGGPGPFYLFFANQFKRITRVKLRVFILKVANWGPHLTFVRT